MDNIIFAIGIIGLILFLFYALGLLDKIFDKLGISDLFKNLW